MKKLNAFYYPNNVDEALGFLADKSRRLIPIAGGTALSLSLPSDVEGLVDITRCGLDYIKGNPNKLTIGAATIVETMANSDLLKGSCLGILKTASQRLNSITLRNSVTLGGNIIQLFPWSDLPIPLLALDAIISIAGPRQREIPADEFFASHPRKQLEQGDLLVEISIPVPAENSGGAYIKHALTEVDQALLSVAATLTVKEGTCQAARLVLGAVQPLPKRSLKAEEILVGAELNEALISVAAQAARAEISPVSDFRAGQEYRSELIEVLTRRCLMESWKTAQEGV